MLMYLIKWGGDTIPPEQLIPDTNTWPLSFLVWYRHFSKRWLG